MTGGIIFKPFNTLFQLKKWIFIKIKNQISIIIEKKVKKFNHIRFKGSDYKKDQLIIKKGYNYST